MSFSTYLMDRPGRFTLPRLPESQQRAIEAEINKLLDGRGHVENIRTKQGHKFTCFASKPTMMLAETGNATVLAASSGTLRLVRP